MTDTNEWGELLEHSSWRYKTIPSGRQCTGRIEWRTNGIVHQVFYIHDNGEHRSVRVSDSIMRRHIATGTYNNAVAQLGDHGQAS
ncbi:hypothetical protein [Nocardia alni]|uniref:hypothetical protein n=1 Tax=Nocardia alni TaxID=2815723 RepID=UPI001C24AA58|nr:hypothetical protein [Nocardia alni]